MDFTALKGQWKTMNNSTTWKKLSELTQDALNRSTTTKEIKFVVQNSLNQKSIRPVSLSLKKEIIQYHTREEGTLLKTRQQKNATNVTLREHRHENPKNVRKPDYTDTKTRQRHLKIIIKLDGNCLYADVTSACNRTRILVLWKKKNTILFL